MSRFIFGFVVGVACSVLGALVFVYTQTGKSLSQPPRAVEGTLVIHVDEDPSVLVPTGDVVPFLRKALRLEERHIQQIDAALASGLISKLEIRLDRRSEKTVSGSSLEVAVEGKRFADVAVSTSAEITFNNSGP